MEESKSTFHTSSRSETASQTSATREVSNPLTVLVVEDKRDLREMLALMLKGMGHTICMAANGREALDEVREREVDIVLLDLMMPEMDGFEFCQAVKEDQTIPELHIIITSGKTALEDKVKGLELGAFDFLTKPFSLAELRARIRAGERIVRSHKELKERVRTHEDVIGDFERIERAIEFPPEYYQPGVSLLAYFGPVLNDKYPDTRAKIKIEQEGLSVRMTVETPEGEKDRIERTLSEYGMVLKGKISLEDFLDNKMQVLRFQNKLELATLELRRTKELLEYPRQTERQRIDSFEQQVQRLFTLIEDGVRTRSG